MKREDLDEFVACYHPANRHQRKATWSDANAPHPGPSHLAPESLRFGRHTAVRRSGRVSGLIPASGAREEGSSGRWRAYDYEDLIARDKASLDIFWLRDDALADSDKLPPPEVIAQEIVDDLEAALEQFRLIAADLGSPPEELS